MRVNEILCESKNEEIAEAPVGFVRQQMKKLGAGVTSKIPGMGNISSRMQGGVEAGNVANNLYKLLFRHLGKSDDSIDAINADYVANFLRTQGFNTYNLKGKTPLGKSGVEQAILSTVQDNYRGFANPPIAAQVQPSKSPAAPPLATPRMTYGQVKQGILGLKPSERAKILQMLQGTATTAPIAKPSPRVRKQKTAV